MRDTHQRRIRFDMNWFSGDAAHGGVYKWRDERRSRLCMMSTSGAAASVCYVWFDLEYRLLSFVIVLLSFVIVLLSFVIVLLSFVIVLLSFVIVYV